MHLQVSLMIEISANATLTQIEEQIQQAGHTWMRQGMKQAVSSWETQHQDCPRCGSAHQRLEGTVARVLYTQFGRVRLSLRRFRCQQCLHRWCPARVLLASLQHKNVTAPLQDIAVLAGTSWPYRHAAQMLERLSGAQISAEEIRRLLNAQGRQMANSQQQEARSACAQPISAQVEPVCGPPESLIGMDGGWVPSREQRGGMEGKVAVIAQDKRPLPSSPRPHPSTLTWYELAKRAKQGQRLAPPHPRARWMRRRYVATFDSSKHLGNLAAQAARQLECEPRSSVVVGDGANWIKQEAQRHFQGAPCILDWPHLWRVMHKAVRETAREQKKTKRWRDAQAALMKDWLWHGKIEPVQTLLRSWQHEGSVGSEGKAVREALSYLEHQRAWIGSYEAWRQQGYPVGSGIIERAVALIINRRMKKRGMRWLRRNATSLVTLRVHFLNTDWQQPALTRSFP